MELYSSLGDLLLNKSDDKGITFISREFDEEYISYKDLCQRALGILYDLQDRGIKRGCELVFQLDNCRDFVLCFWACILGGIIPVPVAVGNNQEHRLKLFGIWDMLNNPYLITDIKGIRVLEKAIDDGLSIEKIESIKKRTIQIDDIGNSTRGIGDIYQPSLEDTAFIQFSSGSTGQPKGVVLSHRNLLTNIDAIITGSSTTEADSTLSWMPLTHDMGLIGFHISPVAAGINQYIMPTSLFIRNPVLWLRKANEHRITLLSSPNFGYKYFLEFYRPESAKDWDLSHIRLIFNGAEPISVDLCQKFLGEMHKHGLKSNVMFNVYGMAEASLAVTFPHPGEELESIRLDRKSLSIGDTIKENIEGQDTDVIEFADLGFPVKGCSVRICDDFGKVLNENTIGNIEIKGENVTSGYYNNSSASAKAIGIDGWLNTGDLGFIRKGRLIVTGRAKDVIFVNGQNYYAHDIERVSEEVDGIKMGRVAAIGVFNTHTQKDDIIIMVLYKKKLEDFAELAVNIKKQIYLKMGLEIANVIPVWDLPKTTSGKIQRYRLKEMYQKGELDSVIASLEKLLGEFGDEKVFDAPQSEMEEGLLEICRRVLDADSIGMEDNLFEKGVDSLKASLLVARIHKLFNVEISLEEFFGFPTIRGLAGYIEAAEERAYTSIESIAENSCYEVTPAQKRLFALDRIEGAGTSYNIPAALMIEGNIDIPKLQRAFEELIRRHDTLRTSFEIVDSEPVQKIHKNVEFSVKVVEGIDAGLDNDSEDIKDQIDRLADNFIKPFDLAKAPLIRVQIVRLSEQRHILLLDMHHIISDGTSMGILVKEFVSLYKGEKLKDLSVQYKDYAGWKKSMEEGDALLKQEGYWLSRFHGEIPVLTLPLDFPRPAVRSFEGDRIWFEIDSSLKQRLKELGTKKGASLYMVLLAAYNILLSKYSGQEDIVVGSPIAGRNHPDTENIVGMFVNTLPLRNFPEGNKTFSNFLDEVRRDTLRAYQNQDYQFEQLVEKLGVKRDMSRNPIFDTMFVLQNMEIPEIEIEEARFVRHNLRNKAAKFDITLEAEENRNGISFSLEYNTGIFKRGTIERLARHFNKILEEIAKNPHKEIYKIDMLDKEEKEQILVDFNDTKKEYPKDKTLSLVFEEQVERTPNAVAVIFGEEKLTYLELNQRANSLARVLRQKGVGKESIVAIMLERSTEMMVGILAVLKAGGAYLPISPSYPEERTRYMLEDSGTSLLLTKEGGYGKKFEFSLDLTILDLDDRSLYMGDGSNLGPVNDSGSLAYVIYTSGSTGKPKGAMIEHYSVINRLSWMQNKYPIGKEDTILQKTPYTFDVSVWELFWWFFVGSKVCFLEPGGEKDPGAIIDEVEKNDITTMHFVPSMLNMFLEYLEEESGLERIASLRQVFASGEALGTKQVIRFNRLAGKRHGTRLINLYGPTEATVDVSYFDCPLGEEIDLVPIGKPIDNIRLYIVDRYNNLQPVGIPGELCIAGDGVGRGYLNRPELTKEKFVTDPFTGLGSRENGTTSKEVMYRTGDLARWLPDGNIEYLGRIDHQVKVRGFRIELGEIEEELIKHEDIKEAVVMAREDKDGGNYLCAYITADREITPAELREHLTRNLPEYMVPSYFMMLDKMPLSPNGKVDRKALPMPSINIDTEVEYTPPGNEIEHKMAMVWEKVLRLPKVGINNDFFELGGDSIKAIQVVSLLAREGIDIEVKDILVYRTIAGILLNVKPKNLKNYGQGTIEGSFGKTPVVGWFFSREFDDPGYYNQSVLLKMKRKIDITNLERVFKKIIEHHDALRINYSAEDKRLYYNTRHLEEDFKIETFDISGLAENEQKEAMINIGESLKAGFDIENGLLIRVALINFNENDTRLLITMHHLVVDGVSWRIILEDLYTVSKAIERGSEIILPPKTASLKEWYEKLDSLKDSSKFHEEKEFWLSSDSVEFRLPEDFETSDSSLNTGAVIEGRLDIEETEKLLKDAHKAYNTNVEDILLIALAKTIREWTGQSEMVIETESHGRNIDDIDVSRTVGWFTAIYPLKLEITREDVGEQIKEIKEQIRSVPQKGIGYGILKYLSHAIPEKRDIAEIRFNYLGRFDQEGDNDIFAYSIMSTGRDISINNSMAAKIEINCMVVNNVFKIDILFSEKMYRKETMEGFRDRYMKNLKDIVEYTTATQEVFFTPSDFETLDINQEDLDMLLG
ncbi:non-ribosomal peptide synthetase [Acetivibrio mesophilus]|uniref:Amino acid adenylation domain-containing protein n=1 Tax=Acetivibrio mesophilus TaxID=2487273 RepID=A0A4Q0I5L0_9FIRM|nr:non-ribosomal peptide synthetase [Acetivibrio mesophilus]RXE59147.1 amino acid adenylation domain-containing protein [Acetivibrio mesophilus]